MKKILLIEDEDHIRDAIHLNLELEGYEVSVLAQGNGARVLARTQHFHLAILDVMLPGTDGFELCRQLKQDHPGLPVLFLTALSDSANRIKGLKLADDYLPKPFDLEELILRVKNLLKRAPVRENEHYSFEQFHINFNSFEIKRNEKVIATLSSRESQLLKLLTSRKNEVVSRDEILDKLWLPSENPSSRTIDNYILNFRKIFDRKPGPHSYFQSVRGVGYKFSDHS